jgi:hypothetical protein
MNRAFFLGCTLATLPALAEVSPDEAAKIQREQGKARDAVMEKYKGKDKLSAADLRQQSKELAEAERSVLQSHGVSPGDWVKATARMNTDDRAKVEAAKKQMKADEEAAAKKGAEPKTGKPGEVVIEKGNEKNEAAEMDRAMGFGKKK